MLDQSNCELLVCSLVLSLLYCANDILNSINEASIPNLQCYKVLNKDTEFSTKRHFSNCFGYQIRLKLNIKYIVLYTNVSIQRMLWGI